MNCVEILISQPRPTNVTQITNHTEIRGRQAEKTPAVRFVGDHTGGVTPVPIPNTAVKPVGPMIVPLARKSVIAGILTTDALDSNPGRLFLCAL